MSTTEQDVQRQLEEEATQARVPEETGPRVEDPVQVDDPAEARARAERDERERDDGGPAEDIGIGAEHHQMRTAGGLELPGVGEPDAREVSAEYPTYENMDETTKRAVSFELDNRLEQNGRDPVFTDLDDARRTEGYANGAGEREIDPEVRHAAELIDRYQAHEELRRELNENPNPGRTSEIRAEQAELGGDVYQSHAETS